DTLIAVVMGAVLFTLVVQGLSIEMLVRRLGLNQLSLTDNLARLEGDLQARREGLSRLDRLVQGGLFSARIADNIREKTAQQTEMLDREIEQMYENMTPGTNSVILALRCLGRERARYHELFSRGLINEFAYRELDYTVTVQLEDVKHRQQMPVTATEPSLSTRFSIALISLLDFVPGFGGLVEAMRTQQIIRDYDVAWGRYRGTGSVLAYLNEVDDQHVNDTSLNALVKVYENIRAELKSQIDEVAEQYPEFVETMQEQLSQRLLLISEHDAVEHAAENGLLSAGIASAILRDQSSRIRQLKKDDINACFEIEPEELLAKVPVFAGIEPDQFSRIARHLRPHTVRRGTDIIRQGDAGDSLFLIARGIAQVLREDQGREEQVATLYAGDFFGEAAMLHHAPRNATARAATPCSLYELKKSDLDRLFEQHPEIREQVESIDKSRLQANRQSVQGS
ncbi:MAG: cyclic nucleotide-binding domain-containing protein, partial [Pseudomonadales bacterium]|nr:cyclic nucleotide-binding domain-containing protein [Pseudomonadales bacterium]